MQTLGIKQPVVSIEEFVEILRQQLKDYYAEVYCNLNAPEVTLKSGRKYHKITVNHSVWAFVAREDGMISKTPVRKGDLLKAASYNAPAKHSRGNLLDGNVTYGPHGPHYMI